MRRRYGRIVNITSGVGTTGNPGHGELLRARMAALLGLIKSLAQEIASRNVHRQAAFRRLHRIGHGPTSSTTEQKDASWAPVHCAAWCGGGDICRGGSLPRIRRAGLVTGQTLPREWRAMAMIWDRGLSLEGRTFFRVNAAHNMARGGGTGFSLSGNPQKRRAAGPDEARPPHAGIFQLD